MAARPKPPPDPLAELAGVASCPDCGVIVRATPWGTYDPGPCTIDEIEAAVGCAWELRQGYGIGRGMPHAAVCPPIRPGELVGLVVAQTNAPARASRRGRRGVKARPGLVTRPDHPTTKARTA